MPNVYCLQHKIWFSCLGQCYSPRSLYLSLEVAKSRPYVDLWAVSICLCHVMCFRKQAWAWMQGDSHRARQKHGRQGYKSVSPTRYSYDHLVSSMDRMRIKDYADDDYTLSNNNNDVDTRSRYLDNSVNSQLPSFWYCMASHPTKPNKHLSSLHFCCCKWLENFCIISSCCLYVLQVGEVKVEYHLLYL